jgi:non-heme chloroperoxidase
MNVRPIPDARSEQIKTPDGARLHAISAGSGPTVVLAHGYLLEHTVYLGIMATLVARGRRVIAFDHRGHGQSSAGPAGITVDAMARDYGSVLAHFGVQDGTLVAHSMSSFLSVLFCLEQAQLAERHLSRLILLGATAGAVARGSLPNRLQIPLLKSGLMESMWKVRSLGTLIVRQLFGRQPAHADLEATRAILMRQNVRPTLPIVRAMIEQDHYGRLSEIRLPTRVLCGTLDRTCPRWHSELLAARIPNAELRWLEGAGHMLNHEAPDAIVDAVCRR